jgi:hypothetical protein
MCKFYAGSVLVALTNYSVYSRGYRILFSVFASKLLISLGNTAGETNLIYLTTGNHMYYACWCMQTQFPLTRKPIS